ncbi:MAG: hypothetical protein AAGF67_14765 [Verrucomicrobiota bacterium]
MPRGIDPKDWEVISEIACDIVNAEMIEDDILTNSYTLRMLDTLNGFRKRYGDHPALLATIGDYLESPAERKRYYHRALQIARETNDLEEVDEILDSLRQLEEGE